MRRFSITLNLILLGALIIIAVHYSLPIKLYNKITNTSVQADLNCSYSLKHFDFHFINECETPNVVMIGNSLTREGEWNSLLSRNDIANRAISGDNLPCICERLVYLKNIDADIWFIGGGVNDIPGRDEYELLSYFAEIVYFVKSEGAIPVINLILYISPEAGNKFPLRKDYTKINIVIQKTNSLLKEFANNNNIDYIDLNEELSENNILKDIYTSDGVHLNEAAYKIWASEIESMLLKYNI